MTRNRRLHRIASEQSLASYYLRRLQLPEKDISGAHSRLPSSGVILPEQSRVLPHEQNPSLERSYQRG